MSRILKPNNVFMNEVLPDIVQNRDNLLAGNFNAIPFSFSKLSDYVYGIQKGTQYGITGPSGSSKSKLGRDMFIYQPFQFYYENQDKIDIRVNMFCLEDNKKKVVYNLLTKAMWDHYGKRLTPKELSGDNNEAVPEEVLQQCEGLIPYFQKFSEKVYLSNTNTATGIKKEIETFMLDPTVGHYTDEKGKKLDHINKTIEVSVNIPGKPTTRKISEMEAHVRKGGQVRYKQLNPNLFVINIIDNLQVIKPEAGNKYNTLDSFCRNLMRNHLCEFFGCANVLIQQQSQQMRQRKMSSSGELMTDTLVPSIAGLGEFKNSVQTMHHLFGIYSPFNDRLPEFHKYDITKLSYFYRHIYLLKSNFAPNVDFPLFSDPIAETFKDLPNFNDTAGMNAIYAEIANLSGISNSKFLL